jgi:hypothetical protein
MGDDDAGNRDGDNAGFCKSVASPQMHRKLTQTSKVSMDESGLRGDLGLRLASIFVG